MKNSIHIQVLLITTIVKNEYLIGKLKGSSDTFLTKNVLINILTVYKYGCLSENLIFKNDIDPVLSA